jgi:hypothetical protein
MLSNPADREKLLASIKEMSNSMTRVDAEKDFQKDVIDKVNDDLGLEKKYVRKLASIYHRQNFTTVQQEQEELVELYEAITAKA